MSDQLSLQVSRALDDLGYNEEMRRYRIDRYNRMNFIHSLCSGRTILTSMLSGSKIEGTSCYSESDFDNLLVLTDVTATEYIDRDIQDKDLVLYMDYAQAFPGYCTLPLLYGGWGNFWHQWFLEEDCYVHQYAVSPQLLSTEVVRVLHCLYNALIDTGVPPSGPSSPVQIQGRRPEDKVLAIRCDSPPSLLQDWVNRHREHGWPTTELIQEVSESDFYVVPVGMKGSNNKHLEWRISFNNAEKTLIHSFNITQYKVYILVKIIVKQIIHKLFKDSITSYMVKTLMLWSAEQTDLLSWTEERILEHLLFLLHKLKLCVQDGKCPNYFLPDNNLLHGKLTSETQQGICDLLTTLLCEGRNCILRCPPIYQQINLYISSAFGIFDSIINYNAEEKLNISQSVITHIMGHCDKITNEMSDSDISAFLTDTMVAASSSDREEREITKCFFSKLLTEYAFNNITRTNMAQNEPSNRTGYKVLRSSLGIVRCNSDSDVLSGKVTLATMLHCIGQVPQAEQVLRDSLRKLRYYTYNIVTGNTVKDIYCYKLVPVYQSDSVRTVNISKLFTIWHTKFEPSLQASLPKALQFELPVHSEYDGWQMSVIIDSEPLAYYLQYLCYTELDQEANADVALSNLVWCATQQANMEHQNVILNILGHIFQERKKYRMALWYCKKSVNWAKQYPWLKYLNHNAALWHIAIILNKVMRRQ